jgi:hypothetical protein
MAVWCDHADTMVVTVSHNDVAVPIRCESIGPVEQSNGPFSVSMDPYAASAARYCGHLVFSSAVLPYA